MYKGNMKNKTVTKHAMISELLRRRQVFRFGVFAFALVFGGSAISRAESNAAIVPGTGASMVIGSDRQLFVDDRLIDTALSRDVTRTMNPPQDIRRVMKPDQPWETLGFIFYASVVDAGDAIQLFYGSYSYDDQEKKMVRHFCLATSQDGLSWVRPQLGIKSFNGSKENNQISTGSFDGAVFIDPHAAPDKRYRLLASSGMDTPESGGLFAESSPDGIHWKRSPERVLPFIPDSQHAGIDTPRPYIGHILIETGIPESRMLTVGNERQNTFRTPLPVNPVRR